MNPPPDMSELLRQAQQMQEQMLAAQEELASRTYEGRSGGGAVKVVVTGSGRIDSIHIDSAVIDPSDPEMLGDLIVVATNQALEAASAEASKAMGGLTGGLDLGGLLG
jgi:DNA-binding YbaB/EbfC family protein